MTGVGSPARMAAVVLAGGAATRLGGANKPLVEVGGVSLLRRVLDAVSDAAPRIVVGPGDVVAQLPRGVSLTRERPAGAGPVAALAAGLALVPRRMQATGETGEPVAAQTVAVLAADLPFVTAAGIEALRVELTQAGGSEVDGAVLVDADGRAQWLCGVWRLDALAQRLQVLAERAGPGQGLAGLPVREVAIGLRVTLCRPSTDGAQLPDWFDCDTDEDVRRAEALLRQEESHDQPG